MAGVVSRLREARDLGRTLGLRVAVERLLLGWERFQILQRALVVEPILARPISDGLPPLEKHWVRCTDIYAHLPTLYKTTVDRRLRRVLELGTRTGESTVALCAGAKEIGGHVTSVDIEPCPLAENEVRKAGLENVWTFIRSDDLALDWREPIDHLFIDTSHTYDQTRRELEKYEPLVAPGGAITLHDTTSHPEVWRAVADRFRDRGDVRVFRYWHNNGLALIEKLRDAT